MRQFQTYKTTSEEEEASYAIEHEHDNTLEEIEKSRYDANGGKDDTSAATESSIVDDRRCFTRTIGMNQYNGETKHNAREEELTVGLALNHIALETMEIKHTWRTRVASVMIILCD